MRDSTTATRTPVPTRALTGLHAASILRQPTFWYALPALNLAFITLAWWSSSGFEMTRSASDFFNGLGRITGLAGTFLVLVQLLLMARVTLLEDAFGMERLAEVHRANGWISMELIAGHAIFQTVGYMLGSGETLPAQLGTFVTGYEGVLAALVGLALLLVTVITSIAIARLRLAYETWYFVHLYTYLAIALAFSHQLQTGADFAGNPGFTAYWIGLYVIVVGALLAWRIGRPLLAYRRHRFAVAAVVAEAPGVTSIHLRGRHLEQFRVRPGQFLVWRFLDRQRWSEAHPFSISGRPAGNRLRMTARQVGGFTAGLHQLRPGTPVLLEGPFGHFTPEASMRTKTLLVAGGVGITPIRVLAEAMAEEGHDVVVLYRARRQRDLIFHAELEELSAAGKIRVHYLLSEIGTAATSRIQWFQAESLLRIVPDLLEREAYVCGPAKMTEEVVRALTANGVPAIQIHTEAFSY